MFHQRSAHHEHGRKAAIQRESFSIYCRIFVQRGGADAVEFRRVPALASSCYWAFQCRPALRLRRRPEQFSMNRIMSPSPAPALLQFAALSALKFPRKRLAAIIPPRSRLITFYLPSRISGTSLSAILLSQPFEMGSCPNARLTISTGLFLVVFAG